MWFDIKNIRYFIYYEDITSSKHLPIHYSQSTIETLEKSIKNVKS